MSTSLDEDHERRTKMTMEDSKAMTIDFLRARLLAERAVSKTARQRADQLSKRVSELEEQLKVVSIMRRKAERATADVLAILENHGITDVSEGLDSNSDHDESCGVNFESMEQPLTALKDRKIEVGVSSSSEMDSSPSTGRSLSWKNNKDSQYSSEKKKYIDSFRRRSSSTVNSTSARRAGKSCRRIKRREARAVEEFEDNSLMKTSSSIDFSNCSDSMVGGLRDSIGVDDKNKSVNGSMLESNSESRKRGHGRDEDMESALQHQAQLIGRFEEEEKAQREWEEKYRENQGPLSTNLLDSCDPGNHSDVTEERDTNTTKVSDQAGTGGSEIQESRGNVPETRVNEDVPASKIASESSTSEISYPLSEENKEQDISRLLGNVSVDSCQQSMPMPSTVISSSGISSQVENRRKSLIWSSSSSDTPKEASNNLESVLVARIAPSSNIFFTLPFSSSTEIKNGAVHQRSFSQSVLDTALQLLIDSILFIFRRICLSHPVQTTDFPLIQSIKLPLKMVHQEAFQAQKLLHECLLMMNITRYTETGNHLL